MASKRVRLPSSAKISPQSGVEDSTELFDDEEATFATERTSGLISDVFETDQGEFLKEKTYFGIPRMGDSISFPIGTPVNIRCTKMCVCLSKKRSSSNLLFIQYLRRRKKLQLLILRLQKTHPPAMPKKSLTPLHLTSLPASEMPVKIHPATPKVQPPP